jgi:hypothetical protein
MVYGCGGRLSCRHRDLFSDSSHHTESRSSSMVDTDLEQLRRWTVELFYAFHGPVMRKRF